MNRKIWIFVLLVALIVLFYKPDTQIKIATQPSRANLPLVGKNISQYQPPLVRKGVALISVSPVSDIDTLNATWCYNWSPSPYCGNHEAVPMIWGRNVEDAIGGDSQFVLGFNEPDGTGIGQSNISASEGADLWHRLEERFPYPYQLVSPAVTPYGRKWLEDWHSIYLSRYGQPPRIHALAFHYYGFFAFDFNRVLGEMKTLAQQWRVNIWITEFAIISNEINGQDCWGHGSAEGLANFQAVMTSINNETLIERYAYYAPRINVYDPQQGIQPPQCNAPLLGFNTGQRNAWGNIYAGY